MFPSPYGVIFILIFNIIEPCYQTTSFRLLTELYSFLSTNLSWAIEAQCKVSVSLRSYIHSYAVIFIIIAIALFGVSVSLRSYIHSYKI